MCACYRLPGVELECFLVDTIACPPADTLLTTSTLLAPLPLPSPACYGCCATALTSSATRCTHTHAYILCLSAVFLTHCVLQRFESVRMSALTPSLSSLSHTKAVVGILKTYTMYGTVGITSGDAIKYVRAPQLLSPAHCTMLTPHPLLSPQRRWIENTASDCDTAAAQGFAEGVTELPVRGASNTAASDTSEDVASLAATSGRGTADLQFVSPSPDFRPWRLCYRCVAALHSRVTGCVAA